MKHIHANSSDAVHTRADHRAGAPVRVQRLRKPEMSPTEAPHIARASSSTTASVTPITIALPSGVGLGGKGHGPNFVGTVILDGPGRKPMAPIPVVVIAPHLSAAREHGRQPQTQGVLDNSPTATTPDVTEGAIIATDTPTPTAASDAYTDSSWNQHGPTPVVVALSVAGVILLMLIAFMIGVCLCRRYAKVLDRGLSLPAFLKRRSSKKPISLRKDSAGSLDKASPMPEKDADGFETRFFVPTLMNRMQDRKTSTGLTGQAPFLPRKESYNNPPSKAISSVARGLAISRVTGMAISMPPALRYEDIIASPVIASPSAVFSPDMNTLSTHSPRDVHRWTSFPVNAGGGTLTGRLIPDTGSTRNSPLIGWSPNPNLRVTNMGSTSSSRLSYSDTSAPAIGLGLVEDRSHGMRSVDTAGVTTSYYTEQSESAEVHEDELQDFAMAQAPRSASAPSIAHVVPEAEEAVKPVPSLSIETIQHLTWRDVPEGSLRTGSPLRVGSCDNLAAISPSSSGMSLVGAVPQSMLRALEGTTSMGYGSETRTRALERVQSELISENGNGRREIPQPRRSGKHGVTTVDPTTSLSSLNRRQIENDFPLPESRYPQRPELNRTASGKSDDLIILSGIAMDGISPIDVPHFPFSLWSSSASAPALASYAATLATIAASGAAAVSSHFAGGATHTPITTARIEPIRTNTLNSTPQKSMTAIPTDSATLSPSLSQMSKSSSAHSVLLLREQRLRSNLEALQRAETEDSLSLSPMHAHTRGQASIGSSRMIKVAGHQAHAPSSSSFSLTNLSIREPSSRSPNASPRKTRTRTTTPTAAATVETTTTVLPTASFSSELRTVGGGAATFVPSSCGSTPASSRSMDTLDTRASTPTPAHPFGYTYSPIHPDQQGHKKQPTDLSLSQLSSTNGDLVVQRADRVGGGAAFLPSKTANQMGPFGCGGEETNVAPLRIYDGAMLALQEKEQQRLLAQHLLGHQYPGFEGPTSVVDMVDGLGDQLVVQKQAQTQNPIGVVSTQFGTSSSSSFSQSFYSQPSAAPSPASRRASPNHQAAAVVAANAALALRDSTNSLNNLLGLGGVRFSGSVAGGAGGAGGSVPPSERGSYISPTLKLFQFYSNGNSTNTTGARRSSPSRSMSSTTHDSSFGSGSGSGLGLGLVGMQRGGGGSGSGSPTEEGKLSSSGSTTSSTVVAAAFARPAVRADGVVDVFCAA
ncbi:hypothetical protein CF327_g4023 [Tilletia walkeri]|nr:hypothetical protein CF327_g4023 [Tilletia walkeri]